MKPLYPFPNINNFVSPNIKSNHFRKRKIFSPNRLYLVVLAFVYQKASKHASTDRKHFVALILIEIYFWMSNFSLHDVAW